MFNSGAADNGYYTSSIRKNTAEEAVELADKIEKHAIHHRYHHGSDHDRPLEENYDPTSYTEDDEDESRLLIEDLIPNDGYFISATAFETLVQRTPLNLTPEKTAKLCN